MRGRIVGVWFGLMAALACAMAAQAAIVVKAVRLWPSPEYSRITLEFSQAPEYKYFQLGNPNRLVLDLRDV